MDAERERMLIAFILELCERLYICSTLLSKCAEKKEKRSK